MENLTATVGTGGENARHDVALVQAMLVLAKRPASLDPLGGKYLAAIDGDCGEKTKRALRQFQNEQVFVTAAGTACAENPGATLGIISTGDATWKKLTAAVPSEFADLQVLRGGKTVYIAGTAAERDASAARVALLPFLPTFRPSVEAVIRRLHENTSIVCGVCAKGGGALSKSNTTFSSNATARPTRGRARAITTSGRPLI